MSLNVVDERSGSAIEGDYPLFSRHFTKGGIHPFTEIEWVKATAEIKGSDGESVFKQEDVEVPASWSPLAVNVVVSKYFRGKLGTPERETSVKDMISRVVNTIAGWGLKDEYFTSTTERDLFCNELSHILVHQIACFNSPVWFNVGVTDTPQCSACFILDVADTMEGILDWCKTEGMIFKGGSGSGVNLSKIRSSMESLSKGGKASGPVSFMRAADSIAGSIKSGGTCLAPHQLVYTQKGPVSVQSLTDEGKDFVVISWDPPSGRYKAKTARAWKSGHKEVYRVTTDKGHFDLSHDHPMKLASGEFVRVKDLKVGQSLFAGTASTHPQGYPTINKTQFHDDGSERFSRMVARDVMGEDIEGKIVHHKNEDILDTDPSNLHACYQSEHAKHHMDDQVSEGTHIFQRKAFPKVGKDNPMHKSSPFWEDPTRARDYKKKLADVMTPDRAVPMQIKSGDRKMLNFAYRLINDGGSIETFDEYIGSRLSLRGNIGMSEAKLRESIDSRFGSYDSFRDLVHASNHSIRSIESVGHMDVYDIEVDCPTVDDKSPDSGHNFLIWSNDNSSFDGSGVIVSNTRRAAKMVILNANHPDIEEFIWCKALEERKAYVLGDNGYDLSLNGEAWHSIQFQNANNSIRVNDTFMEAVGKDKEWRLGDRDGTELKRVKAKELFRQIAEAAWECGDPGMQYDTIINDWHTIPNAGRINGSNPCFTGDTLVATADGRNAVMFKDLVGTSVPIYSWNHESKRVVIQTLDNIRVTRKGAPVYKVTLDDGSSFRSTEDHLIMMKDGTYVQVRDLKAGESVNPFNSRVRRIAKTSTPRQHIYNGRSWKFQYRWIWEHNNGPVPKGYHTHHKDHDALNDRLSNMELLLEDAHNALHIEKMMGDNNPARRCMTDEWRDNTSKAVSGSGNPMYGKKHGFETRVRMSNKAQDRWTPEARRKASEKRKQYWEKRQSLYNHKIVSVEFAGYEDVYDGSVDGTHNFAIITSQSESKIKVGSDFSGLFVHNCSEYMSIDNSSCNLASINLLKFWGEDGFDIIGFQRTTEIMITAMDILVGNASYPTKEITQNAKRYRQLGLGYANLGALLMTQGLPYDSDEGRATAATITSLMTGTAYRQSAMIASQKEPFYNYDENVVSTFGVLEKHQKAMETETTKFSMVSDPLWKAAHSSWVDALSLASKYGVRNSQVSVLAPTGTIAFMMDCDTTGVEPDIALVKHKALVGGGVLKMTNQSVSAALTALEYTPNEISDILTYLEEHETVEGSTLKDEHLSVFDCAFRPLNGKRSIDPTGHIKMMGALQPFISGAISKTVNMPNEATVEDVGAIYMEGWKLGLKAIAIYRDGSKRTQPLSTAKFTSTPEKETPPLQGTESYRKRLPDERQALTHKFSIGGHEGYITVGLFDDGEPGEVFLRISKEGSTLSGMMDAYATLLSVALQYGVPLSDLIRKFSHTRFEPAGYTGNKALPMAKSIIDYIFRWMEKKFLPHDQQVNLPIPVDTPLNGNGNHALKDQIQEDLERSVYQAQSDAPSCSTCGSLMVRNGSCYVCRECGASSGCS